MTPDGKKSNQLASPNENQRILPAANQSNDEDFFDMLTKSQSKRMDDQRCPLKVLGHSKSQVGREPRKPLMQQNSLPAVMPSSHARSAKDKNALLEMIADLQSERMDEQRAQLPCSRIATSHVQAERAPDDAFLDMLMRSQGSRIEEQRSELPRTDADQPRAKRNGRSTAAGTTVPDEDFFSLIMRVQGGRMEDQRAAVSEHTLLIS